MKRFDLVITNGLVVDGSGAAPRVADVAIREDTIVAVAPGKRLRRRGPARTIRAWGV